MAEQQQQRNNRVTIGGIVLERDTGGMSIIGPVIQYAHLTDAQVQELWHRCGVDPRIQAAMDECREKLRVALTEWGDERLKGKGG